MLGLSNPLKQIDYHGALERIGLISIGEYDRLKDLYVEEKITREQLQRRVARLEDKYNQADYEGKARYASPDGKKVLKDLQRALNYLRNYQRAMWVVLAPDNDYYKVSELLEAWGMKPHSQVNDFYARANPGVPRADRTGQDYDSYGVEFIHIEDIDGDDPNFKTDMTFEQIKPRALLESPDDD